MKDSAYKISLDINEHGSQVVLKAKQSDTGRKVHISLRAGGTPYTIAENCYAVFTATKPDGSILYNACTIEGNEIIYEFTAQTCSVIGRSRCEIKLYGLDDKLITSPRFALLIDGTLYSDGSVESTDEFSALTQMVSDTLEAQAATREATKNATEATENANEATRNAGNATENATKATANAIAATEAANQATLSAESASGIANQSAEAATQAADLANTRAEGAMIATTNANTATENATLAADNANKAATKAAHTAKSLMVVGEAKGEVIALDDAIDQFLVGCRIFGKTTQDGTPTPDAPVELVSVGDSGSISVKIASVNLAEPMRDTAFTDTGVTFSPTGDGNLILNGTVSGELWKSIYRVATVRGQTYTVSGALGVRLVVWCTETEQQVAWKEPNQPYISFTANYSKYVLCVSHNANEIFNNLRVDCTAYPGTTPLPWTPYNGQSATISTPNGLPGIPVASGGNYTDANGQQWVCDEIDFARCVYVQRVGKLNAYNETVYDAGISASGVSHNFYIHGDVYDTGPNYKARTIHAICNKFITTGMDIGSFGIGTVDNSGWSGIARIVFRAPLDVNTVTLFKEYIGEDCQVLYRLKDEITTPLSEEELAAYASLHTYRGNTTVSNDAGAYMELEYVMDAKKYIDSLVTGSIVPATVE